MKRTLVVLSLILVVAGPLTAAETGIPTDRPRTTVGVAHRAAAHAMLEKTASRKEVPSAAPAVPAATTDADSAGSASPADLPSVKMPPVAAATSATEEESGVAVPADPRSVRPDDPYDNSWVARPNTGDTITPRFTVAGTWRPAVSGTVDSLGMHLGLGDGQGFDTRNNFSGRTAFRLNSHYHLDGGVANVENRGTLDRAVTFDSLAYGAGSALSLKTRMADGAIHYTWTRTPRATADIMVGYFWGRTDLGVEQWFPTGKRSGTWEQHYHLGLVGVGGELNVARNAWLRGAVRASPFGSADTGGTMTDATFDLLVGRVTSGLNTMPAWYVDLGYRHTVLEGSSNGGSEKLTYSGPTFSIMMEY